MQSPTSVNHSPSKRACTELDWVLPSGSPGTLERWAREDEEMARSLRGDPFSLHSPSPSNIFQELFCGRPALVTGGFCGGCTMISFDSLRDARPSLMMTAALFEPALPALDRSEIPSESADQDQGPEDYAEVDLLISNILNADDEASLSGHDATPAPTTDGGEVESDQEVEDDSGEEDEGALDETEEEFEDKLYDLDLDILYARSAPLNESDCEGESDDDNREEEKVEEQVPEPEPEDDESEEEEEAQVQRVHEEQEQENPRTDEGGPETGSEEAHQPPPPNEDADGPDTAGTGGQEWSDFTHPGAPDWRWQAESVALGMIERAAGPSGETTRAEKTQKMMALFPPDQRVLRRAGRVYCRAKTRINPATKKWEVWDCCPVQRGKGYGAPHECRRHFMTKHLTDLRAEARHGNERKRKRSQADDRDAEDVASEQKPSGLKRGLARSKK